ncbi:MAG: PH domain-containing protein [Anaerolineae bacterium]|nr:PH domain-containing protein [Anaerolineae bacterium]MBL6965630.1 PH domain-containing protein [Anaerolineales bacterium]
MSAKRDFTPELIPRKGEWIAWILAGLALIFWGLVRFRVESVPWGAIALFVILFLSAGSISLGNWVDRHTVLSLDPEGIQYRNGLRSINLKWEDVQEVRVLESTWGQRVQVINPTISFIFRTLGEVRVQDDLKGRLGFAEGAFILKEILASAGLSKHADSEKVRYYTRP